MTLSFSTKWPAKMGELAGQPNAFTNKIIKSVWQHYPKEMSNFISNRSPEENEKFDRVTPFVALSIYQQEKLNPKIHTLRTGNRWKAGMKIHPVINNRTKDRFQFSPILEVKSVQEVMIEHTSHSCLSPMIYIHNGNNLYNPLTYDEMETLAINDGFPSLEAFFQWFDKDFRGQIIHWADFKY